MSTRDNELTALLIAPNRDLAGQFMRTLADTRAFQILSDLKTYLPEQALDLRLRQWKPDVVLIDLASDLDRAAETIRYLSSYRPVVTVIGLHLHQDSEAIVRSLRMGATEFLSAPFPAAEQRDALARILRLRQPEQTTEQEYASVVAFSSTKPGSGASTLATQTAFALQRTTGKRVLLTDFDLMGGTIGFYLKIQHQLSLADALYGEARIDANLWSSMAVHVDGVDVIASPDEPATSPVDQVRLHDILEYSRRLYDFVILDLPAIFHRTSLMCISEADRSFLVTTSELPSLHLTRKAIGMLSNLGFDKNRYQVVVNRLNRKDGLGGSDLEKMFNCPVHATLPNDYFALHRVVTLGEPLAGDGELGKAIESLAGKLSGSVDAERKRSTAVLGTKAMLSQT
jgi:pilus assembly protein CpaE